MENRETVNSADRPRKKRKLSPEEIKRRKRIKMIRRLLPTVIVVAIVVLIIVLIVSSISGKEKSGGLHHITIDVQNYGTIKAELDESAAPITVKSFLKNAKKGFYDGLTFHRISEGFMIQGGDPKEVGKSASAETIKGEFSANGVSNPISHVRGALSMARNSINMDSASTQFFIVQSDSTFLDGQYAGFGYVTEGMEIVDKICADVTKAIQEGKFKRNTRDTVPVEYQPVITAIRVID